MPRELLFFNFCIPQDTKLRVIVVTLVVVVRCDVAGRVVGVVGVEAWTDWVPCRAASKDVVSGGVGAPVLTSRIHSCGGRRVPGVSVPWAGRQWGLVGPPLECPIRVPLRREACSPRVWVGRDATRAVMSQGGHARRSSRRSGGL